MAYSEEKINYGLTKNKAKLILRDVRTRIDFERRYIKWQRRVGIKNVDKMKNYQEVIKNLLMEIYKNE